MPITRHIGQQAEILAREYLKQQGVKIIENNYHSRWGEVDIIARQKNTLLFIEVRYRKDNRFGSGADTVSASKQQKIIRTAKHYLAANRESGKLDIRFDVISISSTLNKPIINWYSAAFMARS